MSIATRHRFVASVSLGCYVCFTFVAACESNAQAKQGNTERLLDDGHYLRAEISIRAAMQRSPNDAHLLSQQSVVDWAFNRFDAAISDAEKAVALSPNDAEAHSKLADAIGAKLAASETDPRMGTFAKISLAHRFRKEIDRTLEIDPNDLDTLEDLAEFYWQAPGIVGGDTQKAQLTADRLFRSSPARAAAVRAVFASDDSDATRRNVALQAIWRTAVAAAPESYEAHSGLAAACLDGPSDSHNLASAEAEAKHAVALDPSRVDAYKTLAILYARTGRWNELDALLKQAREHVADDRSPGYMAAVAILTGNVLPQLPRAEQLLRDYIAQTPEGQAPSLASAHWRLGEVLEKQGRKADAIRELQTATQQDGSLEAAKRDLQRLS